MMCEPTSAQAIRLTDQQTLHDTMIVGQQHIPLTADGYRCQTDDLWRLLLAAAARRTTLDAARANLERAPPCQDGALLSDQAIALQRHPGFGAAVEWAPASPDPGVG